MLKNTFIITLTAASIPKVDAILCISFKYNFEISNKSKFLIIAFMK